VNHSNRPVHILRENHSCDCAKVDLPKRELRPGEAVMLTLSVNVPPAYASKAVSTRLETDDPEHPHWDYAIRFEAFPDARIVPPIVYLGSHTVADMLAPELGTDVGAGGAFLEVFTPRGTSSHVAPKLINPPRFDRPRATPHEIGRMPS